MGELFDIGRNKKYRHAEARSGSTTGECKVTVPPMLYAAIEAVCEGGSDRASELLEKYDNDILSGMPEKIAVRNAIIRARQL